MRINLAKRGPSTLSIDDFRAALSLLFVVFVNSVFFVPSALGEDWLLSERLSSFRVSDVPLIDCLDAVNRKMSHTIVFGYDKGRTDPNSAEVLISADLKDVTLKEVLDHILSFAPQFEYIAERERRLIVIQTRGSFLDLDNLLNVRVLSFRVKEHVFPQTLIQACPKFIPELRSAMDLRRAQARRGRGESEGVVGSEMKGNVKGPKVDLYLEDKSVRDILNAIALWSHENASTLGWQRGFSWVYACRSNPTSSSGLGCDPTWDIF